MCSKLVGFLKNIYKMNIRKLFYHVENFFLISMNSSETTAPLTPIAGINMPLLFTFQMFAGLSMSTSIIKDLVI